MLTVTELSCRHGENTLLRSASATFPAGCVTGLIGPNGAGKSTLLRLMAGLSVPSSGTVLAEGRALSTLTPQKRARMLAYMPQDIPPFPPMPVREIASLGRLPYGEGATRAEYHPAVERALALTGLQALAGRTADQLSGGERARLMLARALSTETPVLLADEAVAALDPAHALAVMHLLRNLAAEGRCIVLVIHDLLLATRFCDQLVLMKDGETVTSLPPSDLRENILRSVYGVTTRRIEQGWVPWDLAKTPAGEHFHQIVGT